MGVLSYARNKGNSFLEAVCKDAVATSSSPSYKQIKMLATNAGTTKKTEVSSGNAERRSIGDKGMVRGSGYYRLEDAQ